MTASVIDTYEECKNKAKELRFHVVSPGLIIAKHADVITIAGKKALTNVKDLFILAKLKERKPEGAVRSFGERLPSGCLPGRHG